MIVVSDTTAVTTLLKAGEVHLRGDLFGEIIVPQAVWDELFAFHAVLPEFIKLRPVTDPSRRSPETETLGRGEAEAIKLANEIHADLPLMDDRKGRVAAARFGITCVALPALLIQAKQIGRIPSVRGVLEKLETDGGLYLSDEVKAEALEAAGE